MECPYCKKSFMECPYCKKSFMLISTTDASVSFMLISTTDVSASSEPICIIWDQEKTSVAD